METRLKKGDGVKIINEVLFDGFFEVPREGLSSSLLLLWKSEINVDIRTLSLDHINYILRCDALGTFKFIGLIIWKS